MKIQNMPLLGRVVPADDNVQMSRKTLFSFMAWGPIVFTAVVGVQTRFSQPEWQFPAATEKEERVVYAYAPYVKQVQNLERQGKASSTELLDLASSWISASEKGDLQPIRPAFFEDRSEDGVKSEIINAQQDLGSLLLRCAQEEQSLTASQRARYAITAIELAETLKYSDFRTLYLANKEQGRATGIIASLAADIDAPTKKLLIEKLGSVKVSFDKFDEVTKLARQQYAESKIRRGLEPLSIEEVQLAHNLASRITTTGEVSSLGRMYASNENLPEYVTQLGIAWGSCQSHNGRVQKLIDALQPSQL